MFEVFLQFHDGCVVQYMRHADQSALYMADYLEMISLYNRECVWLLQQQQEIYDHWPRRGTAMRPDQRS